MTTDQVAYSGEGFEVVATSTQVGANVKVEKPGKKADKRQLKDEQIRSGTDSVTVTVPSYSIEQACKNYGADKKIITIVYVENSKELANNGNNTLTDSSLQIEDKSENKTKEEKQQEKYKKEDLK